MKPWGRWLFMCDLMAWMKAEVKAQNLQENVGTLPLLDSTENPSWVKR